LIIDLFFLSKSAIIIVNYRTPWHLKKCLKSVFEHTNDFHVFLVHNSPDAKSIAVGQEFKNRYPEQITLKINEKNLGLVGGINTVFADTAEFEYICLLNSDVVVTPNWLSNMTLLLDTNEGIAQVSPDSNQFYPETFLMKIVRWQIMKRFPNFGSGIYFQLAKRSRKDISNGKVKFLPSGRFVDFCTGSCNVFRRKHFANLGYFCDPMIVHGYGDDFDNSYYLRQFGEIGVCPASFIYHFVNVSFNKLDHHKSSLKTNLQFLNQVYVYLKWKDRILRDIQSLTLDQYMELRESEHFKFMQEVLWIAEHRPDIVALIKSRKAVQVGAELGIYA
jgi:GT2 family glycosyltransferase